MSDANWFLKRIHANKNQTHILISGETTLGRGAANKIQCPSLMVSRYQCIITLKPCGSIYLRDLDSANGTFINAEKSLKKRDVPLMEGDIIGLGVDKIDLYDEDTCYFFKLCKVPREKNEDTKESSLFDLPPEMLKKEEIIQIDHEEQSETINSIGFKRPATALLSECPSKLMKLSDDFPSPKEQEKSKLVDCNKKNSEHQNIKMSSNNGTNTSTDIIPSELLKLGTLHDKPSAISNVSNISKAEDVFNKPIKLELTFTHTTNDQTEVITLSDSEDDDLVSAVNDVKESLKTDCVNSTCKSIDKDLVENNLMEIDNTFDKQNNCSGINTEINQPLKMSDASLASCSNSNVRANCPASKICEDEPIDVNESKSLVHLTRSNLNQGISRYCEKSKSELLSENEKSNCMLLKESSTNMSTSDTVKNGQCLPLERSDSKKDCVLSDKTVKADIKDASKAPHSSALENNKNDNIIADSELPRCNKTVNQIDDFNIDSNNQVGSVENNSNEYNTKNNESHQSNGDIFIKQEKTSFLSTSYTLEDDIIFINSDDEMTHSQMFDDALTGSNDKDDKIDDQLADDDMFNNMVLDVDDLDDESEEDEWFQKLSQQFKGKEEDMLLDQKSPEEDDGESSFEKIDRVLDTDLTVKEIYNKEKYDKNNQIKIPVNLSDDKETITNIDSDGKVTVPNKDLNIKTSPVDDLKKRKSSTNSISDSEGKKTKYKIKDKGKSSGIREDKRDEVDNSKRKKEKSSSGKESSKHNKVKTSKLDKIPVETGEIQSHKNEAKSSTKSTTAVFVEDDDDDDVDPLKYATYLCDTLARDAEEKKQILLKKELDEIKQNEVKKKTIPPRKTLITEALPDKRAQRSKRSPPETVTTKQCRQSSDKSSTQINKEENNLKIEPPISVSAKKSVKELRKAKLKEISEKNRAKTSSESKVPKPSTSTHVKLTMKNRSAFLVDDFVKDPKCGNNKTKNLGDYKIPRRSSTDQCVQSDKTNDSNANETHYQEDSTLEKLNLPCTITSDQSIEKNNFLNSKSIEDNQEGDPTLKKQDNCTLKKKNSITIPRRKASFENDTNVTQNNVNKLIISSDDIALTKNSLKKPSSTNSGRSILKPTNNSVPFIPQNKSIKDKKRVQFENDENLVKTLFIPFSENSLRKPVKKDASMPPKNIIRKLQQQQPISSQNAVNYYHETIYDICKWKPCWIEEQKKHLESGSNLPPPIYRGTIIPCKDEYVSYADYRRTMYPLLLFELWTNICKAYNEKRPMIFEMAIENTKYKPPTVIKVKSTDIPEQQTKSLVQIYCQLLLDCGTYNFPRFGDLVIAEFFQNVILSNSERKCFKSEVFGYITKSVPIRINKYSTQVHPDLMNKKLEGQSLLNLEMFIRGPISELEPARLGKIRIVKNITSDLRLFRALDNLPRSLLMPKILNPNSNICITNDPMDLPTLISYENAPVLNESQKRAVLMTAKLCMEDSHNIHFIHGPPGTGKSQVIVSLVMQIWLTLHRNNKNKEWPRILLCAPSNAAIDEIFLRLKVIRQAFGTSSRKFGMIRNGRSETAHHEVRCFTLDNFTNREVKKIVASLEDQEYHNVEIQNLTAKINSFEAAIANLNKSQGFYSLEERREKIANYEKKLAEAIRKQNDFINHAENKKIDSNTLKRITAEAEMKLLEGANIVATTLSSCYNSLMEKAFSDADKRFSCCIIDEATQATEPDSLIPLLLRVNNVVLVGDPKQLPATVLDVTAKQNGLGKSLFTRHRMWWNRKEKSWCSENLLVHFLSRQYRMHPAIAEWPSEYFYNNMLQTGEILESWNKSPLLPYVVLSHDHKQDDEGELNAGEAVMVQNLVWCIRKVDECKKYSIGVITPYKRHQKSLGDCFKNFDPKIIEVGTVDNFQGRERDIIIFSCVRTEGIGFLQDIQRLNVALTRARISLIVCGNFKSLQKDETWASLLANARKRKILKYISATKKITFDLIRRDTKLKPVL